MGWKVTRDFYHERKIREYGSEENIPDYMNDNNKGRVSKSSPYKGLDMCRVKVYDDDGELYYEAVCDGDASAEAFHDWAMYDSGCTNSKIKPKNGVWGNFIG